MLTREQQFYDVLEYIKTAAWSGYRAQVAYCEAIVGGPSGGDPPSPQRVYLATESLRNAVSDARLLAGDLLNSGWESEAPAPSGTVHDSGISQADTRPDEEPPRVIEVAEPQSPLSQN